jgi:predicted dehydrogenase
VAVAVAARRHHCEVRVSRVALLGCGRWGRHVLRDLHGLGAEVVVVARSDSSRRNAEEGDADQIVGSVEALPQVDGVVVSTITPAHAESIESALPLGVPIFVEKPMTDDPAAADDLANRAGDRLFVMHKWRYHPGIELLAELARSGELGGVQGVRTTRLGHGNPHADIDSIWILAPHDVSIVLELLGGIPEPKAARVEHVGSHLSGLVGILGESPWAVIEASVTSPLRRREVRLICSEGVAVLKSPYDDHVSILRGDPHGANDSMEEEQRTVSTEWPLVRELRAFLEHLDGGPPPRSSAAEGAAEVRAIAQLRELAGAQ